MKLRTKIIALLLAVVLLVSMPTLVRKVEEQLYPCKYADVVETYAAEYDLDPLLIYTFIRTESSFEPDAVSEVGARGLMQMTEETFEWIKTKLAPEEDITFADLYDGDGGQPAESRGLRRRRQDPPHLPLQPDESLCGEDSPRL